MGSFKIVVVGDGKGSEVISANWCSRPYTYSVSSSLLIYPSRKALVAPKVMLHYVVENVHFESSHINK